MSTMTGIDTMCSRRMPYSRAMEYAFVLRVSYRSAPFLRHGCEYGLSVEKAGMPGSLRRKAPVFLYSKQKMIQNSEMRI